MMKKGAKVWCFIAILVFLFAISSLCFVVMAGGVGVDDCLFEDQNISKVEDLQSNSYQPKGANSKIITSLSTFEKGDKILNSKGDKGMILESYGINRWFIRWEKESSEGRWSEENQLRKNDFNPSRKFRRPDSVEVCGTKGLGLDVRTEPPDLAWNGSVAEGAKGTIIGGPFYGIPKDNVSPEERILYHFWKVKFGSVTGWCAEGYPGGVDYLKKVESPGIKSTEFKTDDFVTVIADAGRNIRTEPKLGDEYRIDPPSPLPKGSEGQVIEHQDNGIFNDGHYWWYLRFGDYEGWCAEDGLELSTQPAYIPKLSIPVYSPTFQQAHEGTTLTYIIRVTNEGDKTDTISLSPSDTWNWSPQLSKTSVTLAPGESTFVFLNIAVGEKPIDEGTFNNITITGTSQGDLSKTSECKVYANIIEGGCGLFAAILKFNNGDAQEHTLNFNVPDYVKISDKKISLNPSKSKLINVVFDPKTSESDLNTIYIDVTDLRSEDSATIPIEFGEFEIIATKFDMATDSYSFPNWGPEIQIVNFELWGNCYGMSDTSILYFMGMERPNNRPNTYMLTKDKPDNAKWKIRLHQWSGDAFLASVNILFADNVKEYEALEKNIRKGIPMLLNMQEFREWKIDIRHTVVAYKIIKKGDKAYIFIYENEKTYDISEGTFYEALPYATYNLTTKEHEFDYTIESAGSPFTKFKVQEAERYIFDKNILVVECPVNVTVTDQYNRIISDDGTNEIPNASIFPSNEQKLFYLPTDLTYIVNISAYDVGNFTLTKVSPITNNTASLNVFDSITTTNETQATLEIAPNRTNPMKIDYNGDGHIDEEKNPDVNESIGMNQPPIASFTYSPPHPIVNQTITFSASSSYDPDGNITNYKWNFGDGNLTNTTDPIITHTYVSAGNYTVNLTVTDDEGEYSYTESSITIKEPIKEPVFYVPDDYTSIQAAVDAANAGDTIIVRDGTYTENVDIDKSITLKSSSGNPEYTIVDVADFYNHVFSVTADHVKISGFTVTGAPAYGIYLHNADYCDISDNICSHSAFGIYLEGSNSNSISDNTCINNGWVGISLNSSTKNSISNNTCSNNRYNGIGLACSTKNSISNNTCSNNGYGGIALECCNQNSISNNLCSNNELGIEICPCWGSNNNCSYPNNCIYLNNFINNDCNAYSHSSTNTWCSPLKLSYSYNGKSHTKYLGNYWSDYTGTDANKNGIGDSPYSIDDRGGDIDQDYYPLMTWSEDYFPSPTIPTPPTSTLTPIPRPTLTLVSRPFNYYT